jgi:predicted ABC-type ATPase
MVVVAGPPGSGKSTLLPVSSFGHEYFNADDRAAYLNGGSYHGISADLRKRVGAEFEEWIARHIAECRSFAIETTLRSTITFQQARLAHQRGFWTTMDFISSGSVEESIRRILQRSYRGGHSASERLVRAIYQNSMKNLAAALDFSLSGIEIVRIYDNSRFNARPRDVVAIRRGKVIRISDRVPLWLNSVLPGGKRPMVEES